MTTSQGNGEKIDALSSARSAGLRYVHDGRGGIRRIRSGTGFRYVTSEDQAVRDQETLARIRALAIPPAWRDVWICSQPNGHLQATGRDARGRKQYRYHSRWRTVRDETKYDRLIAFGQALPQLRARVEADLSQPALPRSKVLATVVRLLEMTLIRVGNEEYAKANDSFGLTTLRNRHVKVDGATVHFAFRGKSGVRHQIDVHDRRLAAVVRRCRDLPGHELFEYLDEQGNTHVIDSADVNDYLRDVTGEEFTAKDFRTWAGTVLTAVALRECEACDSQARVKRNVVSAIASTAQHLGNTASVCRKSYVHPAVIEAYLEGALPHSLRGRARKDASDAGKLHPEEAAVLRFLRKRLAP